MLLNKYQKLERYRTNELIKDRTLLLQEHYHYYSYTLNDVLHSSIFPWSHQVRSRKRFELNGDKITRQMANKVIWETAGNMMSLCVHLFILLTFLGFCQQISIFALYQLISTVLLQLFVKLQHD